MTLPSPSVTGENLLAAVRHYAEWGWCIIPMRLDEKRPAVRWRRYQTQVPGLSTLSRWFGGHSGFGAAVVFGEVSGNLGSRDFDDLETYFAWARQFPGLARMLPTVQTHKGRHVYFRTVPKAVEQLRLAIGKPSGTGAIIVEKGELRIGHGCYSLIPPSPHPRGGRYVWDRPPETDIPIIKDLQAAGLWSCHREDREHRVNGDHRGLLRITEDMNTVGTQFERDRTVSWSPEIERAIAETLPSVPGERNRCVFEFARWIKSIPQFSDAHAKDLDFILREWHRRALPFIGTKPVEETLIDFYQSWPKVKFAKGKEPMSIIFAKAKATEPEVALKYESPQIRLMVSLCRELQRATGDGPFFLSCQTAGQLLEADKKSAYRWLSFLEMEGLLRVVEKGSAKTQRATRWRYLAPL